MNIETIEIPLEEYRMLLRESKQNIREKLDAAIDSLHHKNFQDRLIHISKVNKYKREYELVSDKLNTHEVKFTADDIPF